MKLLLFIALLTAVSKGEASVSNNITTDLQVPPQEWVLPLIQDTCDSSQLFLEINYLSTTDLAIYVYPPFMQTRCDIMSMYYTALGAPAIPDAKNLTAWFIGDIMTGLTCFGFQNIDTTDTAIIQIDASLSCNEFSSYWNVYSNRWIPGWYFSKPILGSMPDIPLSPIPMSSTGSSPESTGSIPSAAQKINSTYAVYFLLCLSTLLMLIH
jgi:hypothetical protein